MTILVTGGLGFVGSHLVERLLQDGNKVLVVDNLIGGGSKIYRDKIVQNQHSNLSIEICSIQRFAKERQKEKFSHIFHLASPVGPAGVLAFAGQIANEITSATEAAISLALRNKCRLFFMSTSEVYGGGNLGLCREDMPCIIQPGYSARLEYALGKLVSEVAIQNTPGLDSVVVRPFNIAGPRQNRSGGFVIPTFIRQAMADVPLTVFGDGQQLRAFTHVSDIVNGSILAMTFGKPAQVYNLGNAENKTSILDLAHLVIHHVTGDLGYIKYTDGKTVFGPTYAEAANKFPDSAKAMNELDWQPNFSNLDIINNTWVYEQNESK